MSMIHQLEKETVQLLTCSQVITSIQSVVKELVENALDAAATSIGVRLENFGLDLIEVKDNGRGVKKDDVSVMGKPHCTSKISSFQNLNSLQTYGFRGEALHSMTKMSKLKVTTRTASDPVATSYEFTGAGEVGVAKVCPGETGTTIALTGLFKTVPVRRQYYKNIKRCKESLKKVEEYMLAFGLAHPSVRFQLRHNSHTLWLKPPLHNFEENAANILGMECSQKLAPLNYQCFDPMVKIKALVPTPRSTELSSACTRATSDRLIVLVNKRPVTVKPITQLVKHAVSTAFPSLGSRYPVAVVMITVLPQAVDVNLDPNKTTVLLHDLAFIVDTLQSLLEQLYSIARVISANNSTASGEGTNRNTSAEKSGAQMSSRSGHGCHGDAQPATVGCEVQQHIEQVHDSRDDVEASGCHGNRHHGNGLVADCDDERLPQVSHTELMQGVHSEPSSNSILDDPLPDSSSEDAGVGERRTSLKTIDSDSPIVDWIDGCHDNFWNDFASSELQEETSDGSHLLEGLQVEEFSMENCQVARSVEQTGKSAMSNSSGTSSHGVAMTSSTVTMTSVGITMASRSDLHVAESTAPYDVSPQATLSQWSRGCCRQLTEQPVQLRLPVTTCSDVTPPNLTSPTSSVTPPTTSVTPPASMTPPTKYLTPPSKSAPPTKFVQSKLSQKRPSPIYDLVNSVPVKRTKAASTVRQSDLNSLKTTPTTRGLRPLQSMYCTADSSVLCDLELMRQRLGQSTCQSSCEHSSLIGWCESSPLTQEDSSKIWLVRNDTSISVFNVKKALEDFCCEVPSSLDMAAVSDLFGRCKNSHNNGHYFHVLHKLTVGKEFVN